MKYSKEIYRRIGVFLTLFAFIFLFGGILLTIADAYYNEGWHWFFGPLSIIGFFALFVFASIFQDKANNWYPAVISKQYLGYMQNLSIHLTSNEYYVCFDLINQEKQIIQKEIRLRSRNKLLVDSFAEGYELYYSFGDEKKEEIWFPQLRSEITIVSRQNIRAKGFKNK